MKRKESNGTAIQASDLCKSFDGQPVLSGVDLKVATGETLAVLGRSGVGKSVLLRLLIGLQKPDSGTIQIQGEEIVDLPVDRLNQIRKRMGFVFQHAALYDSLSVKENVTFPLKRHTKMSERERSDRALALLTRVGMEHAFEKMPSDLSGGMRKRVGLARALALDPEIMLLDEPTAGLDPITAGEINELIQGLQSEREMSSVVVTHDMHCAHVVSHRVELLYNGTILFEGIFEDLMNSDDAFISRFIRQSF